MTLVKPAVARAGRALALYAAAAALAVPADVVAGDPGSGSLPVGDPVPGAEVVVRFAAGDGELAGMRPGDPGRLLERVADCGTGLPFLLPAGETGADAARIRHGEAAILLAALVVVLPPDVHACGGDGCGAATKHDGAAVVPCPAAAPVRYGRDTDTVDAAPQPASLALLGAALVAAGVARRRTPRRID